MFFPGGYGTLDELFEALTLVQTHKMKPIPMILVGREFWNRLIDWDYLMLEGTISPEDLDLFRICDTAEEAWEAIKTFDRVPDLGPTDDPEEMNGSSLSG